MNKKIILICALIMMLVMAHAQKKEKNHKSGYHIKFILEQVDDTMLFVANYYADKTYMYDSIFLSPKEPYTFILKGDTAIPRGVYVVAGQNKMKYFDFIVDSSYNFTAHVTNISPQHLDFVNNITYTNSPENTQANEFMRIAGHFQQEMARINREMKNAESEQKQPSAKQIKAKKEEWMSYKDSLTRYTNQYIEKYGTTTLFGKAQRFAQDVPIPDPPRDSKGRLLDSNFSYYYYVNHYWDFCDFTDSALINTPIFHPRLEMYFSQVVYPLVDSIIKYADILLDKMKDNEALFRYTVWYITNHYERSQYVGHDAVFVHMVLTYYAQGRCPWTDEAVLERMIDHAEQLNHVLIGKRAPELWMFDTNEVLLSNYGFNNKYTIMWFWDVDCGHCKTATPKLIEFYNTYKDTFDFEIYAVCMSSDTAKWKKAIIEKGLPWTNVGGNRANIDFRKIYGVTTTPYLYVLDREKKIIVKKIGVEDLESFFRNHEAGKRIQ